MIFMFAPVGDDGGGCFFCPQVIFCISLRSYKKITQRLSTLNLFEVPFAHHKNYLFFADARTELHYYCHTHHSLLVADTRTECPYYCHTHQSLLVTDARIKCHYYFLQYFQLGLNLSMTFAPSSITTPGFERTIVLS